MTVARRLRVPYAIGWYVGCGATIAIGLATVLRSAAGPAVTVWVTVASIATAFWIIRDFEDDIIDVRRAIWTGAQIGVVVVAAIGLIQLVDAAAMGIIALFVVTSPTALRYATMQYRRQFPDRGGTSAYGPSPDPAQGQMIDPQSAPELKPTDSVTDEDLCLAWRSSFVALSRAEAAESRLRAVQIRGVILDELDRRNDEGLRSWFESGARAASDPHRHLSEPRPCD